MAISKFLRSEYSVVYGGIVKRLKHVDAVGKSAIRFEITRVRLLMTYGYPDEYKKAKISKSTIYNSVIAGRHQYLYYDVIPIL